MINVIDNIILFAELLGAIVTILGLFGGLWKLFKKIDIMQEQFQENTLSILRLTIVNEHLPLDERIKAGEKYIELGGNGSIKKIVNQLINEQVNDMIDQ